MVAEVVEGSGYLLRQDERHTVEEFSAAPGYPLFLARTSPPRGTPWNEGEEVDLGEHHGGLSS